MSERDLSVVIPTRGRPEILGDALAALLRQTYDLRRAEVLVVCDGPDAATVELVARRAAEAPCPLIAVERPRGGQGAARNEGIRRATGRIVLMLDDDIIAEPELLAAHACRHERRDDAVVTGALPLEPMSPEPAHLRVLRVWWEGEMAEMASPRHRPTFRDFVTGNVSVPRARLLEVGGFDEAFTGYGREDYELGYRLLRAGLRFVYEPRAVGVHRYRKPPLEWLRQFHGMGRADVIFARKHPELVEEIMALASFPMIPWVPALVARGERLVLRMNGRGGLVWAWAAAITQGAHYWRGVREQARDAGELRWLVDAHVKGRRLRRSRLATIKRLLLTRALRAWGGA